ncbi:hypothetical protein [Idiomarina ramblicola]|uniref:Uncharacterized protein n=1 Tax=Idiomarina ramblicola TaxID=263724 RepID=A0A432YT75_9GAMM|nr:hypothetical protein [Idiomarina ramblicola]RUO64848.1 hypothetical protein CWI78_11790 [Idiomarina ramblicola]
MTSKNEKSQDTTLTFYRDSRRPQAWGGFFLAIWMAIYIGDAVPLWIIITGALLTMATVMAIVVKFRPLQPATFYRDLELTEKRLILPPKTYHLKSPPTLQQYEEDLAGLNFVDEKGHRQEIIVILNDSLKQRLDDYQIELKSYDE